MIMGISFGMWIIIIFGGLVGIATTLGIVGVMIATVIQKIYRRIRFGISLYD
ncbi:MAG: hypothetical protein SOY45_05455 [Lachnospiraceae bacterium]|nr:hypothetical protein [Lachnospiraceae bacterium]MDD7147287.1 hypothetical protein [Lachnospiraceae bacterium]MDY4069312.1 hypothetical protein [Lachnospiraceae bacterium]